jgi:hypothetical protein
VERGQRRGGRRLLAKQRLKLLREGRRRQEGVQLAANLDDPGVGAGRLLMADDLVGLIGVHIASEDRIGPALDLAAGGGRGAKSALLGEDGLLQQALGVGHR